MIRKRILIIGLHAIFSVLLIYWFYNNSYIRPGTIAHPYKELISSLLVLFVIYLNYLVLCPHFFRKNDVKSWIFLSLLLVGGASLIEFFLVKNDVLKCLSTLKKEYLPPYLRNMLLLIFLRYLGYYLFFTVLKLYELTRLTALTEKRLIVQKAGLVSISPVQGNPILLNINLISYFSQNKNVTTVHYAHGKSTTIYSSLNQIQQNLESLCLRINKETVITYSNVISYDNERVLLSAEKGNQTASIKYSPEFKQNILQMLRERVPELEEKSNPLLLKKDLNNHEKKDETEPIDNVNNQILEVIRAHQGQNAKQLYTFFPKIYSIVTFRRRLKELTDLGLIEFRGAPKTGGYYAV